MTLPSCFQPASLTHHPTPLQKEMRRTAKKEKLKTKEGEEESDGRKEEQRRKREVTAVEVKEEDEKGMD